MKVFAQIFLALLTIAQALQGEPVRISTISPTTVYLVRHGETDANIGKIPVDASHDVSLNATGREQAWAAKKTFDCIPFTAAYSSNLLRSKETASILLSGKGLTATPDPRFRERDRGVNHPSGESSAFSHGELSHADEAPEVVRQRVLEGLNDIVKKHPGETVLLVGHGIMMKYFVEPMIGVPYTDYKINNLDYIKLVYREGEWTVCEVPKYVPVPSRPTTIYLTRHGQTDGNLNLIVQGSTDVPLNKTGVEQAKAAKLELESVVFDAAYSSDLIRAKQTAALVLEGRKLNVIVDPRLRERGFGSLEGKSHEEYYALTKEEKSKHTESPAAVTARAMAALQEIAAAHQGKTVFVASHGGLIKHVIAPIMDIPETDLKIDNLSYAKLICNDGKWTAAETQRIEISTPAPAR